MWSLLLLVFLSNYQCYSPPPAPLQCPVPADRAIAWYNGKLCYERYACCFTENRGGNITASCCYAYGSDGPYKCCGIGHDYTLIIVLSSVFGVIFLGFAGFYVGPIILGYLFVDTGTYILHDKDFYTPL